MGREGGGGEGRTRQDRRREMGKSCLLLNGGLVTPLTFYGLIAKLSATQDEWLFYETTQGEIQGEKVRFDSPLNSLLYGDLIVLAATIADTD